MSASNATVWGRLQAVYSTLAERRHRMLCLRTSDLSVARWNRHGSPFEGRVVQVRQQQKLAGHLAYVPVMYAGEWPVSDLWTSRHSLNSILCLIGNQCNSRRAEDTWSRGHRSEVHDNSSGSVQYPLSHAYDDTTALLTRHFLVVSRTGRTEYVGSRR